MWSRRKFLEQTLLGSGALLLSGSPGWAKAAAPRRLLLVELSGANDGLNTVVPYRHPRYRSLRPRIALQEKELLPLDEAFALHSALKPLLTSWNAGDLAILHGLGYPQPNRSHFKSIALWETGGDGTGVGRSGWMTEDFERMWERSLDAHGISLGGSMGPFQSTDGVWLSMNSAAQFGKLAGLNLNESSPTSHPALRLVLERTHVLHEAMNAITSKLKRVRYRQVRIHWGELGEQLQHAAVLMAAEVETPVIKVTLGGFDTHENQPWRHRSLLEQLAESLAALRQHLIRTGLWEQTLVMTYSEFGRRAEDNHSFGTDHGTAAPHFLMGGAVQGGFYGEHPDLEDLDNGDLKFTMDYRAVYEALLSRWFGISENRFVSFRDPRLKALIS
jgi:uncharacterized protein (DUF1501 family)